MINMVNYLLVSIVIQDKIIEVILGITPKKNKGSHKLDEEFLIIDIGGILLLVFQIYRIFSAKRCWAMLKILKWASRI